MHDGLIFGPALADAYELESRHAIHPRVVLSKEAAASQLDDLRYYTNPARAPQARVLLHDGDGLTFINYLGVLLDELDDPTPVVVGHRDLTILRLHRHRDDKRVWEKYRWVAEYHNAFVDRRLAGDPAARIPTDAMTWRFEPFA